MMFEKVEKIRIETEKKIESVKSLEDLQNLYRNSVGKKGELALIFGEMKNMAKENRAEFGKKINVVKVELGKIFDVKEKKLREEILNTKLGKEKIDVTLSAFDDCGHFHPLTKIENKVVKIFTELGFSVLDGPELESEFYNFDALNVPSDHPARDMQDTFWISNENEDTKKNFVMRTQTSNVQVRAMKQYGAPLSVIIPGRVFRNEATDATHEVDFNQVEGILIDENISIANLKSIMMDFFSAFFEKKINLRMRPGFFPFVEPGFEMDISCIFCEQKGCRICSGTGWIEFMGCGMIHKNVLKAGGIDIKKYNGFAFGFGITRLIMIYYGIDDIRLLRSADLRFLSQF